MARTLRGIPGYGCDTPPTGVHMVTIMTAKTAKAVVLLTLGPRETIEFNKQGWPKK